MSVEGQPTIKPMEKTRIRTLLAMSPEGEPTMVIFVPTENDQEYAISMGGENLFMFFAKLKEFLEGEKKRPAYLG